MSYLLFHPVPYWIRRISSSSSSSILFLPLITTTTPVVTTAQRSITTVVSLRIGTVRHTSSSTITRRTIIPVSSGINTTTTTTTATIRTITNRILYHHHHHNHYHNINNNNNDCRTTMSSPSGHANRPHYYHSNSGGRSGHGSGGGGGGRGEYYKNKYSRHKNNTDRMGMVDDTTAYNDRSNQNGTSTTGSNSSSGGRGGTYHDLRQLLQSIDGGQYPNYHSLETPVVAIRDISHHFSSGGGGGGWVYHSNHNNDTTPLFTLSIGRTQSDPYAPPTSCRIVVPILSQYMPPDLIHTPLRRMATCDYLWRQIYNHCQTMGAHRTIRDTNNTGGSGGGGWSGPKGGDIQIIEPTQHVVEQSAVQIDPTNSYIVCHLTINLPARGRTILGNAAYRIFDTVLAELVQECLSTSHLNIEDLRRHVDCVDDQAYIQNHLHSIGLVSFICNGAILPRRSGIDDRPMLHETNNNSDPNSSNVEPFVSPKSMEVSLTLPNSQKTITGMGIPKGITLICGGGYHGKSTLLEAIQYGVYYKIPNDGREYCMTSNNAMKIRAEDGRWINNVDISSFIKNIPSRKDTTAFSSPDASGSTSQASNIVEAIELGADVLLMDEDTCATNFMIRDMKMMQLVACDKEPITPYVRVIQSLKEDYDISTILVVGGTGDYFHVADHVLIMDSYRCVDATLRAKQIASQHDHAAPTTIPALFAPPRKRYPILHKMQCNGKVKVLARNIISYGDIEIDLSMTEQIISKYQANAIASILKYLSSTFSSKQKQHDVTLNEILDEMDALLNSGADGFHRIGPMNGSFLRPRKLEIGAAMNRLRIHNCIEQQSQTT